MHGKNDRNPSSERLQYIEQLNKKMGMHNLPKHLKNTLSGMSESKIKRLQHVTNSLEKAGKLNLHTLSAAVDRVNLHTPVVAESSVTHRKINSNHIKVTLHPKFSFFMHLKEENKMAGGQGSVIKAYASKKLKDPVYAIKCISRKNEDESSNVAREAKYNLLANQDPKHTFWFKEGSNSYVVYPWKHGIPMLDYDSFEKLSFEAVVRCIISLARDFNQLHKRNLLHGDAYPQNILFHHKTKTLRLIDYGSTQKVRSKKSHFFVNYHYIQSDVEPYKIADDMYSFGYAVALLRPALFQINETILTQIGGMLEPILPTTWKEVFFAPYYVNQSRTFELTVHEKAIVKLVEALMAERPKDRCTSEQVIQYGESLLLHKDELNDDVLEKILGETINRKELTTEDILRGSKRALFLSS